MSTSSNCSPGTKVCKQGLLKNASSNSSKHDTLLTLQNRFEVLQQISDNIMHSDSFDAREAGANIPQTKVAHTSQKTRVQEIHKKQANDIHICNEAVTRAPTECGHNDLPTPYSIDH